MDVEIRAVDEHEFATFVRTAEATFGTHVTDEMIERLRRRLDLACTLAAFDADGELVGTAATHDFTITLVGGATVPTSGVTLVGVLPTHRRRGILRAMMARQLDDVAARGHAFAVLTASESSIYGRFGYGEATRTATWSLRPQGVRLVRPPRVTGGGRVRMAPPAGIRECAPAIYARAIEGIPGTIARSDAWWDDFVGDHEENRDGAGAMFHALHEPGGGGEPDGYVSWRTIQRWTPHDLPDSEVRLVGLHAADPEVEAALFEFVLGIDLVGIVKAEERPSDDHLRWRLADRRRMTVDHVGDGLYVRVLDPGAALRARRYGTTDSLVVELHDPFRPETAGRWRVDGGPDGAACTRTDDDADLAMDVGELGALYLGGVAASTLVRAGRVEERTICAARRADAFFTSGIAPWLTFGF